MDVRTIDNFNFANISCEINNTGNYPSGGAYRGIAIAGAGATIGMLRVYSYDATATIDDYALTVEGSNHNIKGSIRGVANAFKTSAVLTHSRVDLEISDAENGISLYAGNTNMGVLNIGLENVTNPFVGSSLRFMSNTDVNRSDIYDYTNKLSLTPQPYTFTIPAANCDGTDRTVTIDNYNGSFAFNAGTRYHEVITTSAVVKDNSSLSNVSVDYNFGDNAVMKYNITSATDVDITATRSVVAP